MPESSNISGSEPASRPFASRSISELIEHVSDPALHSGGGTVAALVGATAAGVALLVMRVSSRRKSNAANREMIEAEIAVAESLAGKLQSAADRDVEVLDELMAGYAARRGDGGREPYQASLRSAAESTLEIAALIVELLEIVERQLAFASRFIISDLGAAAALAGGAGQAALITARINIELIDASGPAAGSIPVFQSRLDFLNERIPTLVASTTAATEAGISGQPPEKGT